MSDTSVLAGFSAEQINSLRDAILKHDSDLNKNSFIDLGNPPKKPYVFVKFPMLVYKHEGSSPAKDVTRNVKVNGMLTEEAIHLPARYITKTVNSEDELKSAIESGYREDVPVWDESGKLVRKQKAG